MSVESTSCPDYRADRDRVHKDNLSCQDELDDDDDEGVSTAVPATTAEETKPDQKAAKPVVDTPAAVDTTLQEKPADGIMFYKFFMLLYSAVLSANESVPTGV